MLFSMSPVILIRSENRKFDRKTLILINFGQNSDIQLCASLPIEMTSSAKWLDALRTTIFLTRLYHFLHKKVKMFINCSTLAILVYFGCNFSKVTWFRMDYNVQLSSTILQTPFEPFSSNWELENGVCIFSWRGLYTIHAAEHFQCAYKMG